jgi:predicted metal-binding protein
VLSYVVGILVMFRCNERIHTPENYRRYKNKVRKTLARVERQLFLDQYYKAFSLHNGPCTLCEECVVKNSDANQGTTRMCRHHKIARPSMEAMGIDVLQTVRNAGWEPRILDNFISQPTYYGLILVE